MKLLRGHIGNGRAFNIFHYEIRLAIGVVAINQTGDDSDVRAVRENLPLIHKNAHNRVFIQAL
jgi:hypothetical protein